MISEAQAFSLSWTAYFSNGYLGSISDIEEKTGKQLKAFLSSPVCSSTIGSWEVSWGPAILQAALSRIADNTMFACRSVKDPSLVVISVCGTNPLSLMDWLVQDLGISRMDRWPSSANLNDGGDGVLVAHGNYTALLSLLQIAPKCATSPGAGMTLQTYVEQELKRLPPGGEDLKVAVVGHSLGGALAPLLGLSLCETLDISRLRLEIFPIAGPTVGNGNFVRYYENILGKRTTRIWNRLDMVTHVWNSDDMVHIPTLYEPSISAPLIVGLMVKIWRKLIKNKGYQHICAQCPCLAEAKVSEPQKGFMYEMAFQHSAAYFQLLNISFLMEPMAPYIPLFADLMRGTTSFSISSMLKELLAFQKSSGMSEDGEETGTVSVMEVTPKK